MAWEENSCISLNMQLIAILSRIGVWIYAVPTGLNLPTACRECCDQASCRRVGDGGETFR